MTFRISQIARVGAAALAVTTLMALAGCTQAPEAEGGTLTFVTYQGGDAGVKYQNLVEKFEKANPGVKVKLEILAGDDTYNTVVNSRISGGTAPDLFQVLNQNVTPYLDAKLLTDLSDQPWVERQVASVTHLAEGWGGMFAFVPELSVAGVFYNTELFEKYGVEVPQDWDSFLDAVKTFRDAGITPLAVGAKDGWPLQVQFEVMQHDVSDTEEDAAIDSGKLTWSKSTAREIVQGMSDLVAAGAYDPNASGVDWPSSANDFAAGNAAMLIQGSFAVPAIRAASPDGSFGMFPMPFVKAGETAPIGAQAGGAIAIPVGAPNAELAKKFLDFWATANVNNAYLTDAAALSSFVDTAGEIDPSLAEIAALLPERGIDVSGLAEKPAAVSAAIQSSLQGLFVGTATVDSVLAELDAAQAAG